MKDPPPRSDSAFEVRGVEAHAHGSKLSRADEMDRMVDVRGGWLTTRLKSSKIGMESSKVGTRNRAAVVGVAIGHRNKHMNRGHSDHHLSLIHI